MIYTIVVAIIVFGVLIAVHELGHLLAAKAVGAPVIEFAIGMGKKLFSFKKGGTEYSLRLLPIGGYCKIEGEDESSENPNALYNKSVWARLLVMVSGAVMNIILGFIIYLVIVGAMTGDTVVVNRVSEVIADSPAYQAGLQSGDSIVKINNKHVYTVSQIKVELFKLKGAPVDVTVKRGNDYIVKNITPYAEEQEYTDANGKTTVQPYYYFGYTNDVEPKNVINTITTAYFDSVNSIDIIIYSLGMLASGGAQLSDVSGPVGIMQEIGKSAKSGLLDLLSLAAIITINLGIFNLLPFPALDGTRMFFVALEGIFRKPVISRKAEGYVHLFGFIVLLGFVILVDILHFLL